MPILRTGTWDDLAPVARLVRLAVFVEEQGIPESEEWDDDDHHALHVVAFDKAMQPIGTARLIYANEPAGHARIGRMAVMKPHRGEGVGRLMLEQLLAEAQAMGITALSLHAQVQAKALYERCGFTAVGPVFDEVGIPHQHMSLRMATCLR